MGFPNLYPDSHNVKYYGSRTYPVFPFLKINCFILISHLSSACLFLQCYPVSIYLPKVNNRNTRTRCEIRLKLTINTTEWRQWRSSGVFVVNFEFCLTYSEHLFIALDTIQPFQQNGNCISGNLNPTVAERLSHLFYITLSIYTNVAFCNLGPIFSLNFIGL